jgi:hypothetical protein
MTDIGTETASYKVLPMGNNVYSTDSICILICYPSQSHWTPCLLLLTDVERTDSPLLHTLRFEPCVERHEIKGSAHFNYADLRLSKGRVKSLIRNKSDTTQFLWVTIDPTYKLTTGKLNVQYALFTYVIICSFWFFKFEYSNFKNNNSFASPAKWYFLSCVTFLPDERHEDSGLCNSSQDSSCPVRVYCLKRTSCV